MRTTDDPRRDDDGATGKPSRLGRARGLFAPVGGSVAFDHAVGYYDETRGLSLRGPGRHRPPARRELPGVSRVVEVGAGTGLVTVPMTQIGVPMTAVDLSEAMLRRLHEKATAAGFPIPITVADGTRLPFADDAFDGLIMRHVLHLIVAWRDALEEVVRVLRPGSTFLVSITDYTGLYHTLQERFVQAAGGLPIAGAASRRPREPERAMAEHGAIGRVLPVVRGTRTLTIMAFLRNMERGVYTWTWAAPRSTRCRAVREGSAVGSATTGRLDRPVEPEFEIEWRAFRLAG